MRDQNTLEVNTGSKWLFVNKDIISYNHYYQLHAEDTMALESHQAFEVYLNNFVKLLVCSFHKNSYFNKIAKEHHILIFTVICPF